VVALKAAATNLKHGGKLVIDFMNTDNTIARLVAHETKEVQGISFDISRKVEKDFIVKTIQFSDNGQDYCYEERVRALRQEDFMEYFGMAQLRLVETFGDYHLGPFLPEQSERIIFVLKK
jgi:hypothetical protein